MMSGVATDHRRAEGRSEWTYSSGEEAIVQSSSQNLDKVQMMQPRTHGDAITYGRQAAQSIAPFLTKHIPSQLAPPGQSSSRVEKTGANYCYRHHPDLRCKRQANEKDMDQLQTELELLPEADRQGISQVWSLFSAAPSKYRTLMLQGILSQCCFPQLSYTAAAVHDLIKIDFVSVLPTEIALRILCFLDPTSLCKAAQVSSRWRALADDDVVWHRMCEQHIDRKCTKCGWGLPLLDQKRLRTEKRMIQLRAAGQSMPPRSQIAPPDQSSTPSAALSVNVVDPNEVAQIESKKRPASDASLLPSASAKRLCATSIADSNEPLVAPRLQPWKEVYRERHRIGMNWKHGRYNLRTFRGHTDGVMCLQFDHHILATGSYDSTIKIWDIETGQQLETLRGHRGAVRCLQFDDSKLASGSFDNTVKIWNIATGELLTTLEGHTDHVIGLHLAGTLMATGSADHTARVWNFKHNRSIVLRGHTDWVNDVKIDLPSRTLFTASDDCTVRLWNLDNYECLRTYTGHAGQVQQVVPLPPEFDINDVTTQRDAHSTPETPVFSFSRSATTSNHLSSTPTPHSTADKSSHDIDTRPAPPRYMLTAALDSTIRLWDVHTGRCIRPLFGHIEGVWGLAANTLRVISGGQDGSVRVWDLATGKCDNIFARHRGSVNCVGLSDRRICSGGEDGEVMLYSFCAPKDEEHH